MRHCEEEKGHSAFVYCFSFIGGHVLSYESGIFGIVRSSEHKEHCCDTVNDREYQVVMPDLKSRGHHNDPEDGCD
jgi:hypothetical protein